mgnify:CR=1 FL=1
MRPSPTPARPPRPRASGRRCRLAQRQAAHADLLHLVVARAGHLLDDDAAGGPVRLDLDGETFDYIVLSDVLGLVERAATSEAQRVKSGPGCYKLGLYCMVNGFWELAAESFRRAAALMPPWPGISTSRGSAFT